jgi:hypothetical protein
VMHLFVALEKSGRQRYYTLVFVKYYKHICSAKFINSYSNSDWSLTNAG